MRLKLRPLPQRSACWVLPLPCSLLDSEEMRLEIEKMKETDALTEAIREFGKVGRVQRLLSRSWC